jgi:ribosomal protein L11 methyltransferase
MTRWMEIKVRYKAGDDPLAADLISDQFYALGVKGVVVEDPHLTPAEGWGADAVPLPEFPAIIGYLPFDGHFDEKNRSLLHSLNELSLRQGFTFEVSARSLDEEDWAESWKSFFHPEKITDRLVVKPTWEPYAAVKDELVIEIDPGMAFGTGTHPTTAMCMQLLQDCLHSGEHVLDVGTGSGILLIGAVHLGAGRITGVDNDPVAVEVARSNLQGNHIPSSMFDLHCGHLVDLIDRSYDVVVANILADVVLALLDDVARVLKPGGVFIGSGIIESRRDAVVRKMAACDLTVFRSLARQEWVALAAA